MDRSPPKRLCGSCSGLRCPKAHGRVLTVVQDVYPAVAPEIFAEARSEYWRMTLPLMDDARPLVTRVADALSQHAFAAEPVVRRREPEMIILAEAKALGA